MPSKNSNSRVRVVVWNEFLQERRLKEVRKIYPNGIHEVIAASLKRVPEFSVKTSTLDQAEQGLGERLLNETDVLIYWAHVAHGQIEDKTVERVQKRVLEGMGLIVLHSGHYSKLFKRLMGTSCALCWREAGELERVWVVNPGHPIARGIDKYIEVPHSEMYGEPFGIPNPDEPVFISWYEGGEVFRSGNCYFRGSGRIFYFGPGHECYPIYHQPEVQRVLANAVMWARPQGIPADVPRHVPVEEARQRIRARGPSVHRKDQLK